MASVVLVACTIPFFADFMNLIGAVANTLLIFIFPVVVFYSLIQFHAKLFKVKNIAMSIIILLVGIIGGKITSW